LSKRRAGWLERRHAYDSDVNDETSGAPEGESTPPAAGLGRADVHMHTNLGDGWISPARLVQTATLRQLTLIAVTDHDHVEGATLFSRRCPWRRLFNRGSLKVSAVTKRLERPPQVTRRGDS
jgi:hypothetical protein